MRVRRPPLGRDLLELRVRVAPLGTGAILVLVEDLSEERRVDVVRRDFVANVSHELKTPVGALSLLAEAVLAASDDPEQVRHFAERMQIEAARLSHLVQDLIDLSRLQGDDPLTHAEVVDVDDLVRRGDRRDRTLVARRATSSSSPATPAAAVVLGDERQLLDRAAQPAHQRDRLLARRTRGSRSAPRTTATIVEIASPTRASASRPTTSTASSSGSTASTRPARASPAAPASGWRSSSTSARTTAASARCGRSAGAGSTFTLRLPAYQRRARPARRHAS